MGLVDQGRDVSFREVKMLHVTLTFPLQGGHFALFFVGKQSIHGAFGIYYMGVSKNNGTPKWMVYNGKPY